MESFLLWQLFQHFVPQAYWPPIIIILAAFLGLEQWLASTDRIKANSTLQAIVAIATAIMGKMKDKQIA